MCVCSPLWWGSSDNGCTVQASSFVRYTAIATAGVTTAGISRANFQFSPQGLTIILSTGSGAPELPYAWGSTLPSLSPGVWRPGPPGLGLGDRLITSPCDISHGSQPENRRQDPISG